MLDGIFSRSVVLLTEHSQRGTKGFIVNRQTKSPLVKTFKVHPRIMRAFGANKVHDGGPVRTDYAEVRYQENPIRRQVGKRETNSLCVCLL
ncbi:hypothetical protein PINS_up007843 [Pythium insidiosum]|nr:hypothetical protein PINS_up007843 [Pythium insidiosum]